MSSTKLTIRNWIVTLQSSSCRGISRPAQSIGRDLQSRRELRPALNHPNIATIYSIEEVDGETFFVMEYIDGQELRNRIRSAPFSVEEAVEYTGRFSPDGRWIAYSSDESGKFEVFVQAFPVTSGKWQVSVGGGAAPIWSKDGKEIFYLASDKKLMSVDVKTAGGSIEQGVPKQLFSTDVDNYQLPNRYTISRDGKRFLVNNGVESTGTKPIAIVLNWMADTKTK